MLNNFTLYDMARQIENHIKYNSEKEDFTKTLEQKINNLVKYIKENK